MRNIFKKITAFMIVFAMIMSLGISAYTQEANITEEPTVPIDQEEIIEEVHEVSEELVDPEVIEEEPVDPEVTEEPVDPEVPEEPIDLEIPEEPVDPEVPEEPVDPEVPVVPIEPEVPVDPDAPIDPGAPAVPEIPIVVPVETLTYTVRYYVDGIEEVDWEIVGEVLIDYPIVEEVPHYNMPEGYIVDEISSTALPFEVSEEDNVIEVYYEFGLMRLMLASGLEIDYNATSEVFPLSMTSTNTLSLAVFAWFDGSDLFLAIGSQHNKPLQTLSYNWDDIDDLEVHRANNESDQLIINGNSYGTATSNYPVSDPKVKWNVVNIGNQILTGSFILGATFQGGGHDISGITVYIDSVVLVYHQYDGGPLILDEDQSGSLDNSFGYSVYPKYNGYDLVRIEIEHNDVYQPDGVLDPDDMLRGTVPVVGGNASAVITFIYETAANGEITITKELLYGNNEDDYREFDIFIYGPGGTVYVVTLTPGESKTITGLAYGDYTIEEIVPMNFRLVDIDNGNIVLTKNDFIDSATVTNKRDNDGWFYDDYERENKFTVRVITASREFVIPKKVVEII